jgi:hypothetical protein
MVIPFLILMLAALPVGSAYLSNIDMTEYATEGTCYCHGVDVSPDISITINVTDKVPYNQANDTVSVNVGILGDPQNLTGFAMFLNGSKSQENLRWVHKYSNSTGEAVDPRDVIKINSSTLWTIAPINDTEFNVSFVPGSVDQEVTISVTGLRANDNDNETGDLWNVAMTTIEVRKQRMSTLNVTVTNSEPISITEVEVDFYIDGEFIGSYVIPHIGQDGRENATIEWDVTYVKDGKHKLRTVIDPKERITVLDREDLDTTMDIWLGEPPEEEDYSLYYGLGTVAVGAIVVLVVFWLWRRRQYRF